MPLTTPRLTLRPWRESDAQSLFTYASNPDIVPAASWPLHRSVAENLDVIRNADTEMIP